MDSSSEEINGRLFLWYSAVEQCDKLLQLASKIEKQTQIDTYSESETKRMYSSFVELAIIYFCQILNNGNPDTSKVAGNTRKFRETHWRTIVEASLDSAETEQLIELIEQLKTVRDQMLGHADGKAFDIMHFGPTVAGSTHSSGWQHIDIGFFHKVVKKLHVSFGEYFKNLS